MFWSPINLLSFSFWKHLMTGQSQGPLIPHGEHTWHNLWQKNSFVVTRHNHSHTTCSHLRSQHGSLVGKLFWMHSDELTSGWKTLSGSDESLLSDFWWSQSALMQSTDDHWAAVLQKNTMNDKAVCLAVYCIFACQDNNKTDVLFKISHTTSYSTQSKVSI